MGAYGYPRATGDFDIWVDASQENSKRIYKSLSEFGASISDINEETFCEKKIVFQVGVAPRRIDIITHIDGVDFAQAYKTRQSIKIGKLSIPFISKRNLIRNKRATGRPKDRLDAGYLKNKERDE